MSVRIPQVLYHGTGSDVLDIIKREGLDPRMSNSGAEAVYLAVDDGNAMTYPEFPEHDVQRVLLAIDTKQLNPKLFGPDMDDWHGDDHRGMSFDKKLAYSLKNTGQLVYRGRIPPSAISVSHVMPLRKNEQPRVNTPYAYEDTQMSLRAMFAESEIQYNYKIYTTYNIHTPDAVAMIRIGLAGRMCRGVNAVGIIPFSGTKSDKFPEAAMLPVYVTEIITGLPLGLRSAVLELSLALNVAQELIKVEGKVDLEAPEEVKEIKPYVGDGEPNFLTIADARAAAKQAIEAMPTLKDLLGDLTSSEPEEVKTVYEGFSITQLEAEMVLGEDLQKGFYVVRGLNESGRVGISGPYQEVPINYPLDLDRAGDLTLGVQNSVTPMGVDLVEYDVSLMGKTLREMNYSSTRLAAVKIQDTDTGRVYPVLVTVGPGMGDEEIRNQGVQEVAQKYGIEPSRLIAMDPAQAQSQQRTAQVAA